MILFVGNFLCKHGYNPTYLELLSNDLKKYQIYCISNYKNKILRLIHMIIVFYKNLFVIKLLVIDTYSTRSYYFSLVMSIISRLHRKPYILNLSGGDLENRFVKSNSFKTILKYSTLNISPSQFIYDLLEKYNVKSIYIPNYLNLELYPYYKRSLYNPKLLWIRSFHNIYNPEMAIETLRLLQKKYPNCHLCMVGPDKDNSINKIRKIAEKFKIHKNLTLTGKLTKNQIIKLSKNYDVFINTTNFDNLPISVLEVMALGLPVVSTNVGGLKYLLNDSNSILVNKNDSIAMSNSVIEIIETVGFGNKLSMNARKDVEKKYNKKIVIQKWTNIFDKFIII